MTDLMTDRMKDRMKARRWFGRSPFTGRAAPALLLGLAGLAACKFAGGYDSQTVQDASQTQTDVDTLLEIRLNPPPGTDTSYAGSAAAYNKINVDLDVLGTEAAAQPHNGPIIADVAALAQSVAGLQQLDDAAPLSPAFIKQERSDLNTQIGLIIRTETDKKALQ